MTRANQYVSLMAASFLACAMVLPAAGQDRTSNESRQANQDRQTQRDREDRQQQMQRERQTKRDRRSGRQQRSISAPGKIKRLKEVELRGADEKHTVVLLESEKGNTRVVDLGASDNLAELDLQEGDTIAVEGDVVQVGNRQVLMARNVRSKDKTRKINRSRDESRMASRNRGEPRRRAQTREASRRGQGQPQPDGWIVVATDYDRDGFFDGYGLIHYTDLSSAREKSQQRAEQSERARRDREMARRDIERRQYEQRGRDQQMARRRQGGQEDRLKSYSGEVRDLRTAQFRGRDADYLVAEIRVDDGNTKTINLGAKSELNNLDLGEGDRIAVLAREGRINDRMALIAEAVRANNKTADVRSSTTRTVMRPTQGAQEREYEREQERESEQQTESSEGRNLKRFSGELTSLRTTSFQGREGDYLIGEIRSADGETKTVNLGGKEELEDLELSEGNQVSVLAREARINREAGLVAELVRANGQTADVRSSTSRQLRP